MPKGYYLALYLPDGNGDSYPFDEDLPVAAIFSWAYDQALYKMGLEEGEVAVAIRLDGFPLGAFILPFEEEEETPQMREMTVAEFCQLLQKDWREAFRILPASAHSKVDAFLAAKPGQ